MEHLTVLVPVAGIALFQAVVGACCCLRTNRRMRHLEAQQSGLLDRIHKLENPPPPISPPPFIGGTTFGYPPPPIAHYSQVTRPIPVPSAPPAPPRYI